MGTSRIGVNFSIVNFPINENFDCRINSKEEFNYLRYSSSFGDTNVGVSFLDSEPINVRDNIIVEDLTELVESNSPRRFYEITVNSQTFDTDSGAFLITDVFKTTSLGSEVPLYYRHDLSHVSDLTDIELLDANFNPVNRDEYVYYDETATLGYDARYIYTNLQNNYDEEENAFTVYYVRYRDPNTNEITTVIMDSKPFYLRASFTATARERVYTITPGSSSSAVQVYFSSRFFSPTPLPGFERFSVRSDGTDRVATVKPVDLPATARWLMRFTRGEFFRDVVGERLFYHIPEYFNQFFSPVPPYKQAIEKTGQVLDDRLIYVAPHPIANLEIDGFYVYIAMRNNLGQTVRAFTNDPSASRYITKDSKITDVYYELDMIDSIDATNGMIRLSSAVDTDLVPYVTYRYEENFYTYRGLSVNSTVDPDVLNKTILFYIIPEKTIPLNRAVFHLLIDEQDNIVEAQQDDTYVSFVSQATGGDTTTLIDPELGDTDFYTGFEIQILSGLNAGRRLKIDSYNPANNTLSFAVPFEEDIVNGTRYRVNKKSRDYSFTDPVSSTTFNYSGWLSTYTAAPNYYVLLSNTFVVQTLSPRDIDTFDIRIRGGGIKENKVEESLKLQDEAQWYWDVGYWDGQPYPGMGAMVVEIPRSVLKEVGGAFERPQVEEIVKRHMASGSYPVIRYYDRSTTILKLEPGNTEMLVRWKDIDAGSYNLYFGVNPDNLQLYRNVSGSVTELLVEGLDNDKVYYFRVNPIVGGIEQLPSDTVFGIPFDPSTVKPAAIYGQTIYIEGTYQS